MWDYKPSPCFYRKALGGLFKSQYTEDKPFSKGSPTSEEIKVTDVRNFEIEKQRLIQRIGEFSNGGEAGCTLHPHPFFGNLTPTEWSKGMYKHTDHHLKQFGG